MDKVKKDLAAIERKLTKANKIVAKGSSMKLSDAIKLGSKGNSITSTLNKGVKEYKVCVLFTWCKRKATVATQLMWLKSGLD